MEVEQLDGDDEAVGNNNDLIGVGEEGGGSPGGGGADPLCSTGRGASSPDNRAPYGPYGL